MRSPCLLLATSLLTTIYSVSAEVPHDLMTFSCTELIVDVQNQTEADFFSSCPSLPFEVSFTHTYKGSFSMPGVKSIGKFVSGYLGPKLKGSSWIDDGVTSISMPDLLNTTNGGLLFGYLPNLTSVDFPKLNTISGDWAMIGNPQVKALLLPALSNVTGGALIDGDFDTISLPALKTIGYLIVKSTGDLDCIALGKNLSSLVFTPGKYDSGVGFTCWTVDENNRYNSSDAQSSASGASSATTTNGGSTPTGTNTLSETSKASEAGSRVQVRVIGAFLASVAVAIFSGLLV